MVGVGVAVASGIFAYAMASMFVLIPVRTMLLFTALFGALVLDASLLITGRAPFGGCLLWVSCCSLICHGFRNARGPRLSEEITYQSDIALTEACAEFECIARQASHTSSSHGRHSEGRGWKPLAFACML